MFYRVHMYSESFFSLKKSANFCSFSFFVCIIFKCIFGVNISNYSNIFCLVNIMFRLVPKWIYVLTSLFLFCQSAAYIDLNLVFCKCSLASVHNRGRLYYLRYNHFLLCVCILKCAYCSCRHEMHKQFITMADQIKQIKCRLSA